MASLDLGVIRKLERSADDAESQPQNPNLPHAFGRYQITVPTAQTYGFKDADPDKLKDPDYNTQVASKIVSTLNERYEGNDEALIAYNGGDGMAHRWLMHNKSDEILPKETRDYVGRGRSMFPAPQQSQPQVTQAAFNPQEAVTKLTAAGYSTDQINDFLEPQKQKLRQAGFNEAQISNFFGVKVAGKPNGVLTSVPDLATYFGSKVSDAFHASFNAMQKDWETRQEEAQKAALSPTVWGSVYHFFNAKLAEGKTAADAFGAAMSWATGTLDAVAATPIAKAESALIPGASYDKIHSDVMNAITWGMGPEGGMPGAIKAAAAATDTEIIAAHARVATAKTGNPQAVTGTQNIADNLVATSIRTGEDVNSIAARAEQDPVVREQIVGKTPVEEAGSSVTKNAEGDELVIPKLNDLPKEPTAEEVAAERTPTEALADAKEWEAQEPIGSIEEARAAVRSRITEAERPKMTFGDYARKAYDELFDDQAPWKRLLSKAREGKPADQFNNAEALQSLATGARGVGHYQIETAQTDLSGNIVGKGLKDILSPLKPGDDFANFEEYAVSRRAVELHDKNIETGLNDNAVRMVANDPAMKERYEPILQELVQFQNNSLNALHQGGMLSDAGIKSILEGNDVRIPFRREVGKQTPAGAGGTVYQPVKGIAGSDKRILGPIEQIMRQTFVRYELAAKNRANAHLMSALSPEGLATVDSKARPITLTDDEIHGIVDAAGGDPNALGDDFGTTIFRHFKFPIRDDQVPVWSNGASSVYTLADPEAAKALRGMGGPAPFLGTKLMSAFASVQRAGIVLKPGFSLRQVAYDLPFQFVVTPGYRNTVADFLTGMTSRMLRPELHDEYMRSGAWRPAFDQVGDRYIKTQIAKYYGETDFFGGVRNALTTPLRGLKAFADYIYQSQRRGRYVRERAAGRTATDAAMAEANDAKEAAAAASGRAKKKLEQRAEELGEKATAAQLQPGRDAQLATFHTGEKGSFAAQVNRIQPFFSAYLNGWKRFGEAAMARPAETLGKTIAVVTTPVLLNYWAYKDEDWYKEAPDYKKDMGILLPPTEKGGEPYFIPVVPGLSTIFAALPRRIAQAMHEAKALDGKFFEDFGVDAAHEMIPWQATYNAAMPLVENMANYSFFRGRPHIDPNVRRNVAAPEQYTPYTSEAAKQLSKFTNDTPLLRSFNLAPWQIDNLAEGWGGGLGQAAMKYASNLLQTAGRVATIGADGQLKPNPPPEETMADNPWFGSFTIRYPSAQAQSVIDFGDRFSRLEQAHGSLDVAFKNNDLSRFQELAQRNPIASMMALRPKTKIPNLEPYLEALKENRRAGLSPTLAQLRTKNKALTNLRQYEHDIRVNPDLSAHDKRQLLDMTYGQMVMIARQGNQLLDALGVQ